jgi:hypothetical protein
VVTGYSFEGDFDLTHAIVCRFGEYGVTPAVYKDKDEIICVTPALDVDADSFSKL